MVHNKNKMFQDEQGWYKDVHYQERTYRDKRGLT